MLSHFPEMTYLPQPSVLFFCEGRWSNDSHERYSDGLPRIAGPNRLLVKIVSLF